MATNLTRLQDSPRHRNKGSDEMDTIKEEVDRKTKENLETLGQGHEGSKKGQRDNYKGGLKTDRV